MTPDKVPCRGVMSFGKARFPRNPGFSAHGSVRTRGGVRGYARLRLLESWAENHDIVMDSQPNNSPLNEAQERHLKVTCEHVDKLLSEIEGVFHASESKAVFPRYIPELSAGQRSTIEGFIARLRSQILEVVERQHLGRSDGRIAETHAIETMLTFIEIALHELTSEMKGYGAVAKSAQSEIQASAEDLLATVNQMQVYLLEQRRRRT